MKQKIGFIGLGAIGAGICSWTAKSGDFDVMAFDVDPARVQEMVALGARAASSVSEVAEFSDVIAVALPNPKIVRSVLTGTGGVLERVRSGAAIFDLSTNDADTSRDLAKQFEAKDALYIDAPHSGGKANAANGTLPLILGAKEEELTAFMPFLKCLSSSIFFVGSRGAASVVKIVNNVMSMGNLLVAAEAFTLGVKSGVDAGTLFNIIQHCGGSSQRLLVRFPKVLKGDFSPAFAVDLAEKDLALALDSAQKMHVPMLMTSACHQFYQLTSRSGRGADDVTAVVQYLEELTGVELRGDAKVEAVKWGG